MENVIQSLWIGPELSLIEQLCIKSYLSLGYEFHLYTYDDVKNIPDGTTILDANEILPSSQIFRSHNGSVAHFADWFRWKLLYEKGGVWVDMDLIALKRMTISKDIIFGCEEYGRPSIGLLKFPPKHEITKHLIERCEHPNRVQPYDNWKWKLLKTYRFLTGNSRNRTGWGEAGGPLGFLRTLRHFGKLDIGESFAAFYPISVQNWQCIFDDSFSQYPSIIQDSYAIHLWNEKIRRNKKSDVVNNYSPDSLFAHLLERFM